MVDVAVGERNGLVDEAGWWTKRVVTDVTDVSGRRGGVVYNSCQQLFGVSVFTTFIGLGQPRRSVLGQLQDEGALTYNRDRDEIVVPLVGAGPPPPAPTPDAV